MSERLNDQERAWREDVDGRYWRGFEPNWDDLCPDGAARYYEGDDPDGFVREMKERFGFDPSAPVDQGPGLKPTSWTEERGYSFMIPAGKVEAIYGSERWPLGS